jgi:energy-coupling factor transporter ATP-binding protein EcfA2
MYVEKIEIPAFRVLRDVVLEFGEVYDPQIFPIGSENGGGKSTLLQLVFALLHCSAEPSRHPYLKNLLASDSYASDEERMVARLTIKIDDESHVLKFVSLNNVFLARKLDVPPQLGFDSWDTLRIIRKSIERDVAELEDHQLNANSIPAGPPDQKIQQGEILHFMRSGAIQTAALKAQNIGELQAYYSSEIAKLRRTLEDSVLLKKTLESDIERIAGLFIAHDYKLITTHAYHTPKGWERRALVGHVPGQSTSRTEELLLAVASSVYLLGPSNQQYIFLGKRDRRALLAPAPIQAEGKKNPPRPQIKYMTKLAEAERAMTGFFAYDWLSVEPLVQLFASARDEDFKGVVKTGNYGQSYATILREVNALLIGKQVRPLEDLSGVEFVVMGSGGRETKLSPEDLSQGELKRLMIYAWLRANKAVDALVLIDEIEASFHPDWQVGIVRDLQEWAPKNQYLLATHSYELCQALTPRHVRELQPRLPWREPDADDAE